MICVLQKKSKGTKGANSTGARVGTEEIRFLATETQAQKGEKEMTGSSQSLQRVFGLVRINEEKSVTATLFTYCPPPLGATRLWW
jgi:hypothetical protein